MADNNPAQNDVLTPPSLIGNLGKWMRPLSGDVSCSEVPSAQHSPRHLSSNRPDEHSKSQMKEGAVRKELCSSGHTAVKSASGLISHLPSQQEPGRASTSSRGPSHSQLWTGREEHKRLAMPCITLRQGTHGNVSLFGMEPGGELHRLCTVRCGDIIVEVDGKSALGLTEKEVRAMLCGQKGSICRISWIAPDKLDIREFGESHVVTNLVRDIPLVHSVSQTARFNAGGYGTLAQHDLQPPELLVSADNRGWFGSQRGRAVTMQSACDVDQAEHDPEVVRRQWMALSAIGCCLFVLWMYATNGHLIALTNV